MMTFLINRQTIFLFLVSSMISWSTLTIATPLTILSTDRHASSDTWVEYTNPTTGDVLLLGRDTQDASPSVPDPFSPFSSQSITDTVDTVVHIRSEHQSEWQSHQITGSGLISSDIVASNRSKDAHFYAESYSIFEFSLNQAHFYDFSGSYLLDYLYGYANTSDFNESISFFIQDLNDLSMVFDFRIDIYDGDPGLSDFYNMSGYLGAGDYLFVAGTGTSGQVWSETSTERLNPHLRFDYNLTFSNAKVPEPNSLTLLLLGLLGTMLPGKLRR